MGEEGNSEIVSLLKNLTDRMSKMEVAINNRKTEIESIAKNLNMVTSDENTETEASNHDRVLEKREDLPEEEEEEVEPRHFSRLRNGIIAQQIDTIPDPLKRCHPINKKI